MRFQLNVSEIFINQGLATGRWHEIGIFHLANGAELRLIPVKSCGTVAADAFAVERIDAEDRKQ